MCTRLKLLSKPHSLHKQSKSWKTRWNHVHETFSWRILFSLNWIYPLLPFIGKQHKSTASNYSLSFNCLRFVWSCRISFAIDGCVDQTHTHKLIGVVAYIPNSDVWNSNSSGFKWIVFGLWLRSSIEVARWLQSLRICAKISIYLLGLFGIHLSVIESLTIQPAHQNIALFVRVRH